MKQIRFTRQFNFAYALTFFIVLASVNYIFYKYQESSHDNQQSKLCELIFTNLSPGLEYGLSFGNKSDLEQTLYPLRNNPDIAYVKIVDNQDTTVAQVDNRGLVGISQDVELQTLNRDIIQRSGYTQQLDLSERLLSQQESSDRKLGQIQIAATPFNFSHQNNKASLITINIALILPLLIFWIYLKLRQGHQKKVVKKLIDILNDSKNYQAFKSNLKTSEGSELLQAVEHQVIKTQNLRHQLNLLKSEVQQARLDANTELHEFIGFITQQDFNTSINNLMLFYDIIKHPVQKDKDKVWCRDLITQTLTELSDKAKEQKTLLQDSFSGNRMNYQIETDAKAFKQMLKLLLQELITICQGYNLNVHFDLRQDYQVSAVLRISLSSKAPDFIKAIKAQSLFQFDEELPVTVSSNNIQLISAKHILRKFGGEYFYFSDEFRFELPLTTLELPDDKVQPEPIAPLSVKLSVLVYDSDPIDKMVLIGYLNKLGAEVDKATTKQVILQKLRHDNYDAILVNSDFLKDAQSFTVDKFLQEIEELESKPQIIIVSHNHSITESEIFQKLGTAKFISKPVDPKKLGRVLSSL
ncbi:response regulator [Kangiella sediminilitoris]|uniref:response regulator n=1 Tax=Kangiella sediminilitoris TaxID=1144748 RepID=UPI00083E434B|nr:response regulator [Kangiella sediminilitoris]